MSKNFGLSRTRYLERAIEAVHGEPAYRENDIDKVEHAIEPRGPVIGPKCGVNDMVGRPFAP